ncbi:hypothetical protein NR402_07235 [Acidithiobacillus ferrooxidans]|nr:hypothetical protein [Acidithiobacillus ferrooxidans]MCR2830073.1 hypothetical protein [Acidithiobacillus ferrooxidans]
MQQNGKIGTIIPMLHVQGANQVITSLPLRKQIVQKRGDDSGSCLRIFPREMVLFLRQAQRNDWVTQAAIEKRAVHLKIANALIPTQNAR